MLGAEIETLESIDEAMTAERHPLQFPSGYKAHELERAEVRLQYYLRGWLFRAQPLGDILAGNSATILDELVSVILYSMDVAALRTPSPACFASMGRL